MSPYVGWEQRYAIEMIQNGATQLGGRVEIQQELDEDGFHAVRIVIHLNEEDFPALPPAFED